jgi:hypothetical protein
MLVPPAQGKGAPAPAPTGTTASASLAAALAAPPPPGIAAAEKKPAEPAPKVEAPKPAAAAKPAPAMEQPAPKPAAAPQPAPMTPATETAKADMAKAEPMKLKIPPKGSEPAAAMPEPNETVVISSANTQPVKESREFIPALVAVNAAPSAPEPPGSMVSRPLSAAEKNVAQRFEVLKRLLDEDLITPEEYVRHRTANLGALLPYTRDPGAVGLERPVPSGEAIIARLEALRRSLEMRSISAKQHAMERAMIVNALLPDAPTDRMNPMPPPEDVIQAATIVSHLQTLRGRNLISAEEFDGERKAIELYLRTGSFKPSTATAKADGKNAGKGKETAKAADSNVDDDVTAPVPGPVLHLASFRSQDAAKRAWEEALGRNKALLGQVKQIIRRVDLGADRGVFYRLMAGPYASLAAAETACIQLKQNNQFCRASADGS